jgi:hypothetical protein
MYSGSINILVLTASLVAPAIAGAQAPKSDATSDTGTVTRRSLPAPDRITAALQPDGRIRVDWAAVDSAVRYRLTRSVPPAGVTEVSMPNPSDTQYVDTDVRPGSTYYYGVAGVDESGGAGLSLGSAPVTAVAPVTKRPADQPLNVMAVLDQNTSTVSWSSTRPNVRFRVERGHVTSNGDPNWVSLGGNAGCCLTTDQLEIYAAGSRLIYRVRAVDSLGALSDPALSNEITVGSGAGSNSRSGQGLSTNTASTGSRTVVRPAVVAQPATIKVGGSLKLGTSSTFTRLHVDDAHWVSLDHSTATVDARGQVQGRGAGSTHIIAIGTTGDGSIASMVQRIDVTGP